MASPSIVQQVKTDAALQEAERQNWGPSTLDVLKSAVPVLDYDPYEGKDGPCGYGQEMDKLYWEDMPIDTEIINSHKSWVSNRRQWSGVSKYLQESIEPTVDWRGIKSGMRGPPEPIPQNCSRAELTEYGPATCRFGWKSILPLSSKL